MRSKRSNNSRVFAFLTLASLLLLCSFATSCNPQVQNKENATGNYDDVVSVAVNDFVRHEKRLFSQSDVFDVKVYSEAGKAGRVFVESKANDGDHMHYVAVISPKDTTVSPIFSKDDKGYNWTWISSSSDTLLAVDERFYSESPERYTISYSPEGVLIDYSSLPNRMLEASGKLFVWQDEAYEESKAVIDTLIKLDRVDFWVKGIDGWIVDTDGEEEIYYDLDALRNGKIKKYHGWFPWGYGFQARVKRAWYMIWHS